VESITCFVLGKIECAKYFAIDWNVKCQELTGESRQIYDSMVHLIILPNYKEELETLCDTLEILQEHPTAKSKYIICLAMEEAEPGCREKADKIVPRFREAFLRMIVTVHPKDVPGESRGKGTNVSYAAETCKKILQNDYSLEEIMVTCQDADTHFVSDYFACVSYKFSTADNRTKALYTPPISFYGNSLQVPAAVRVTDMVWCLTVLNQLSTGRHVKFPCSCYSLSMDLCNRVGFWDKTPEAIGEDAHMFLKCLFKTDGQAYSDTIFIPAGCYNVCDDTWVGSIKARYYQMYRHLWGTFDLAYIMHQSFLRKGMKLSPKLWAFYEMFKVRVIPTTVTLVLGVIPNILKHFYPEIYLQPPYSTVFFYTGWIQTLLLIPYLTMACVYEKLHSEMVTYNISRGTAGPQHRRKWYHFLIDWTLFPFISLLFYMVCSLHVCIKQMWTDSIMYVVAKKPTGPKPLEEVLTGEN
jgi:hypothetical protein